MVSLASRTGGRRLEGERRPVTRRSGVAARIRRAFFISPQDDDAALVCSTAMNRSALRLARSI